MTEQLTSEWRETLATFALRMPPLETLRARAHDAAVLEGFGLRAETTEAALVDAIARADSLAREYEKLLTARALTAVPTHAKEWKDARAAIEASLPVLRKTVSAIMLQRQLSDGWLQREISAAEAHITYVLDAIDEMLPARLRDRKSLAPSWDEYFRARAQPVFFDGERWVLSDAPLTSDQQLVIFLWTGIAPRKSTHLHHSSYPATLLGPGPAGELKERLRASHWTGWHRPPARDRGRKSDAGLARDSDFAPTPAQMMTLRLMEIYAFMLGQEPKFHTNSAAGGDFAQFSGAAVSSVGRAKEAKGLEERLRQLHSVEGPSRTALEFRLNKVLASDAAIGWTALPTLMILQDLRLLDTMSITPFKPFTE